MLSPSSATVGLPTALELTTGDRLHGLLNLGVRQRRPAADDVPGADELERYSRIDVAAEQVAGKPGNAVIAHAGADAVSGEACPLAWWRRTGHAVGLDQV